MAKLRIVTDSTADIPESVRKRLGIEMVPLKVHFGDETYLDSVTLHSVEFYEKLKQSPVMPASSQPSPADFLDVYKRILAEDPDAHIVSIHISSAMSGTLQSAELAKSLLDDPDRLTVFDSRSASYGIGMLAVAAAEMAAKGASLEEVLEKIRRMREKYTVYFLVDTLEYLQKGGRIGKAAAVLGTLLNIKPILSIDAEGEVTSVDKVRGSKKAVQRMIELFKQNPELSGEVDVVIAHSNDAQAAENMEASLRANFNVRRVTMITLGPVIGTHTGPGTVGVFVGPCES